MTRRLHRPGQPGVLATAAIAAPLLGALAGLVYSLVREWAMGRAQDQLHLEVP